MYPINLTYHEQTRRLALDDVAVSTGDIGTDEVILRTLPTAMRGETLNLVFRTLVSAGPGKVEYAVVPLTYHLGMRRWKATIPKDVLESIRHDPVAMQLRVGEGKHYFSLNAVQLTATKAIITK